MNLTNTRDRYGSLSIGLHWLMVLQLIGVYACINLNDVFPKGSELRIGLTTLHFMLGLSVLAMVLLRIAARWSGSTPAALPGTPAWQARLAGLTHLGLYALLLCNPVLGWLTLSAQGKPIPFFGLQLPALLDKSRDLASQIKEIHEIVGVIGYYLIGLHVAAALLHHYYLRDRTLRRMWPAAAGNAGPGR